MAGGFQFTGKPGQLQEQAGVLGFAFLPLQGQLVAGCGVGEERQVVVGHQESGFMLLLLPAAASERLRGLARGQTAGRSAPQL